MGIINRILYKFSPKLAIVIFPRFPTSVPNFSQIGARVGELKQFLNEQEKIQKFAHLYLSNTLCNFLQIWYVIFLSRWAPPQQIQHQSDERLCMQLRMSKNRDFVVYVNILAQFRLYDTLSCALIEAQYTKWNKMECKRI